MITTSPRHLRRSVVIALAFAVGFAACGSDDSSNSASEPSVTTPVTAAEQTTVPETTTTPETTATPDTTSAPQTTSTDSDSEEQHAADAWTLVFDSAVAFDVKAPHLEDADALRDTIESYEAAGSGMGGITLVPTSVIVDGDMASVTYDVNFGAETAYNALEGEMSLVDGVWTVSRDEFCGFMASARNACPS